MIYPQLVVNDQYGEGQTKTLQACWMQAKALRPRVEAIEASGERWTLAGTRNAAAAGDVADRLASVRWSPILVVLLSEILLTLRDLEVSSKEAVTYLFR